ncbi:MAG: hypothetical protein EBU31_16575, partial [Proteobacteria bacterium]|nr:hypothetical protein [Pseudomonadota bacterium]
MRRSLLALSLCALAACSTPHSKQVRNEANDRFDRANTQVLYDQALQSFHAGQFELALQHIDKAIMRFPKDGSYPLLRGRILLEMKRVDLARESFAKAAELSPTAAEPHYYLGIVLQRWNELDKAAAEYAKNIAEAAFNFASNDAGLSGFQAGWASLHLFAKLRGVEGPMAVLEAERFLYPQHGTVFHMAGKLNEDWTPWLAKEARRLMS